jgi:DNA-binding NtrC family response regulator
MRSGRVLIVDDDADNRETLRDRLRLLGFEAGGAGSGREALAVLPEFDPALILLDLQMPEMGGIEFLQTIRAQGVTTPVVVVTAYGSLEKAVQAMREGAYDFITKPYDPAHLEVVIDRALERERLHRQTRLLQGQIEAQHGALVGEGPAMRPVLAMARQVADSSATVLLIGESGTGKEMVARQVHQWSPRRSRPFMPVNCAALSEALMESELFGHLRGAFTGAVSQKKGLFEEAQGGTIFLDEVGDTPPPIQGKLLRVLQDREVRPVGSTRSTRIDVRMIAATNRDLGKLVAEGKFREDLYFRLNVVSLPLPPLRERPEDLAPLVKHFLQRFAREMKRPVPRLTPEAEGLLTRYHWPGNVRELQNVMERAVVLTTAGQKIEPAVLAPALQGQPSGDALPLHLPFHDGVKAFKRQTLRHALERTGGNQTQAARLLGLQPTYFFRLMRMLGLKPPKSA